MENEFNEKELNEIIIVKQLPEITQKLQLISDEIDKRVEYAVSLEVNEDTVKEVKKERATLNKIKENLETRRKEVKSAVLKPYEEFETVYNNLVKTKLSVADETLKDEITKIEDEQKSKKEEILRDFFLEYQASLHLENIINFEDIGLNITLTASEKSLKEQIVTFCEKVENDLKAIQTDDFVEEILLEYKNNGFNYAKAKNTVVEKHKIQEELKQAIAKNGEEVKQEEIVIQNVETMVSAPVEVVEEELFEFEFKVRMTKSKAKELKEWLNLNEIEVIS